MYNPEGIYLGLSDEGRIILPYSMCNRHGLIAGASGTGKTVTMKIMAEAFADAGVPTFVCDIKGDVSGLCVPGEQNENMEARIDKFGIRENFRYKGFPVCFWDIYGEKGHPLRATVSDIGPTLLSRILNLTETQEGVLNIVFRIADDRGFEIIDLKDLRAMLNYVLEHRPEFITTYGTFQSQSVGAIVRALIPLEADGGEAFFGEPMLDIRDFIRTNADGQGYINLLDSVRLAQNPKLYAMFLLWLMSELYEELPEVGDLDKPRLVFFFDEAHMLFTDAPKALVAKIEQVVKLIRSKGVGIFFVTQNPADIPDAVLAQLSHRVQHALRAYTPNEQKAVRAAAQSFRPNPNFKTEDVISELGVGKALVSVLDEEGVPSVVQKTSILCPESLMAPADDESRKAAMASDGMSRYDEPVDNESAFEVMEEQKVLDKKAKEEAEQAKQAEKAAQKAKNEKKKKEDYRKRRIESQLISIGGSVLKRGILDIIKRW